MSLTEPAPRIEDLAPDDRVIVVDLDYGMRVLALPYSPENMAVALAAADGLFREQYSGSERALHRTEPAGVRVACRRDLRLAADLPPELAAAE